MSRFIETIRLEQGKIQNLRYHEERISRTQQFFFKRRILPPIGEIFKKQLSPESKELGRSGISKFRIIYTRTLEKAEVLLYSKPMINQLCLLEVPEIDYSFKYADREKFNEIRRNLKDGMEALLVVNSRITDTCFSNVAFLKNASWLTPKHALLNGTQRSRLLEVKMIHEADIQVTDLRHFSKIRLFNAMLPWEDCIELNINNISL